MKRSELSSAVKTVGTALRGNKVVDHVHLSRSDGWLRLHALGLDLELVEWVEAPGADFDGFVKLSAIGEALRVGKPSSPTELRTTPEGVVVAVDGIGTTLKLSAPGDDVVVLDDVEGEGDAYPLTPADVDKIRRAAVFASDDEARPILTGVWFDKGTVTATDSYRAYTAPTSFRTTKPVLIPSVVAQYLDPEGDELIVGTVNDLGGHGRVWWSTGSSVLIEGELPNIKSIFAAKTSESRTFDVAEVLAAVEALGPPPKVDRYYSYAAPVILDGETARYAPTKDFGGRSGPCKLSDPIPSVGFNVEYLVSVLKALGTGKATVRFSVDVLKPWIFSIPGRGRIILMPVRVP